MIVTSGDHGPLSLLATCLPPGLTRRVVTIAVGDILAYRAADWRDALVVIERGQIELEHRGGQRSHFGRGDIIWLYGLPVRLLHNPGADVAVLIAISRQVVRPRR